MRAFEKSNHTSSDTPPTRSAAEFYTVFPARDQILKQKSLWGRHCLSNHHRGRGSFQSLPSCLPSMFSETSPSLAPSHHSRSRGKGGVLEQQRAAHRPGKYDNVRRSLERPHIRAAATPATWAPWVLHSEDWHPIPLTCVSTQFRPLTYGPTSSRMVYKVEIIDRSRLGHIRYSVCAHGT